MLHKRHVFSFRNLSPKNPQYRRIICPEYNTNRKENKQCYSPEIIEFGIFVGCCNKRTTQILINKDNCKKQKYIYCKQIKTQDARISIICRNNKKHWNKKRRSFYGKIIGYSIMLQYVSQPTLHRLLSPEQVLHLILNFSHRLQVLLS